MKSYLAISCLAFILVLAYATYGVNAGRVRRSVNFTPSWGKRSVGFDKAAMMMDTTGDKCMNKAVYMSMLIETLKVQFLANFQIAIFYWISLD